MWNQLLVDVEKIFPSQSANGAKLNPEQVEQLQCVENANDNFQISTLHGVAAIGELIVHAANHGELSDELAMSAGWLINSLALLSMSMAEGGQGIGTLFEVAKYFSDTGFGGVYSAIDQFKTLGESAPQNSQPENVARESGGDE